MSPEDRRQQISQMARSADLDFTLLLWSIWREKYFVIIITLLFGLLSAVGSLVVPNTYRSSILLTQSTQSSELSGGLLQSYSGLANLAGLSLPGGSANRANRTVIALETLKSRGFVKSFIDKRDLKPDLFAVSSWDKDTGEMSYDEDVYDEKKGHWHGDSLLSDENRPSDQEAYDVFSEMILIQNDQKNGLVTLTLEHKSPIVASAWLSWIVEDLNNTVRAKDIKEAEESVRYLTEQVSKTGFADLEQVFFELIERQLQTVMLANTRPEYVFSVIDAPVVAEKKASPNRYIFCLLGLLVGFFSAILKPIGGVLKSRVGD